MDNSDDIYKQTADLDSGSAHNEGPPKIQKPTQSIKLPENPLLRVLYNLHAPQIIITIFFLGSFKLEQLYSTVITLF